MSNAIVEALENAAERIGKALGVDLSTTMHKLLHDTGDKIESSVKAHVEHDARSAEELKNAARRVESPSVHGAESSAAREAEQTTTRAASAPTVRVGDGSSRTLEQQLHDPVVHPDNADIVPKDYDVLGGKTPDEWTQRWTKPSADPRYPYDYDWPGNRGAEPGSESIRPPRDNEPLDRIGGDKGTFLSPTDTEFGRRALPPDRLSYPRSKYTVDTSVPEIRSGEIQVRESTIAGWFEQDGGGKQMEFVRADPSQPFNEWKPIPTEELKRLHILVPS